MTFSRSLFAVNELLLILDNTSITLSICNNINNNNNKPNMFPSCFQKAVQLTTYTNEYFAKHIPIGKYITASYDCSNNYIIVYQAFNKNIANYAVKHQSFDACPGYNPRRMTWIKTNFLWMMYRSAWGSKDGNQSNTLAIYLDLQNIFIDELLANCVNSKYKESLPYCANEHRKKIRNESRIVLQWDPHHLPNGNKIMEQKRAIQLGMKGEYANIFRKHIIRIEDISEFVEEQNMRRINDQPFQIPLECVLDIENEQISRNLMIGLPPKQSEV